MGEFTLDALKKQLSDEILKLNKSAEEDFCYSFLVYLLLVFIPILVIILTYCNLDGLAEYISQCQMPCFFVIIICSAFLCSSIIAAFWSFLRRKVVGERNKRIMKQLDTYESLYSNIVKIQIEKCSPKPKTKEQNNKK